MQKSIRRDLSIRIGLLILCISLVFGASYYIYSIDSHDKKFEISIEQQTKHIFNTLTVQLWLFDLNTTREFCKLVSESPNVCGLRLLDHKKEVIFAQDAFPKEVAIHVNKELRYEGERLVGYVDIYFSDASWEQQRRNILFVGSLMVLGTIFLAFIFINVLLKRYLSRPLEDLQKDMVQLSQGNFQQSILVGQKTEIQNIIDTFNELAIKLQKRDVALLNSKTLLDKSQEIAHVGSWKIDLKQDKLIWSDEVYR
ncbi:MAG: HAMP domain-containing protein, partial [Candidatus Pacebacteria bacterium]|nr:HAMP domain-containing protein [Candidatus Paceibacterota bacterium]